MRNIAIGLVTAAALGIGLTQNAQAVDVPLKAAPMALPISNWTGLYIGGNFGYGASDGKSSSAQLFDNTGVEQTQSSFSLAPYGWVGGGQIGYNWQFSPYGVLGAEWDWQATNQHGSACGFAGMACSSATSYYGVASANQKFDWISTLRARLGWAEGISLLYVTGGVAWGKVDTNLSADCPTGCGPLSGPSFAAANFSDTKAGWVLGGGIEMMFAPGWSAKVEYLHVDLGSISHTVTTAPVPAIVQLDEKVTDNIFRVGVNYKFWGGN